MRRFLISFVILGLMAGSAGTAEAAKRRVRTVVASYYGPQLAYEYRSCASSGGAGCVTLQTRANERSLTARVMDAHGQPVSVLVVDASEARYDLDGPEAVYGAFCGKTTQPIRFKPGTRLELWIGGDWWPTGWSPFWFVPEPPNCSPGVGTTGTVHVTLSS